MFMLSCNIHFLFNDEIFKDEEKFHKCCDCWEFDSDRTVTFYLASLAILVIAPITGLLREVLTVMFFDDLLERKRRLE